MVKNWLITGGCGFIGTSLIQSLLEKYPASNIRVLDNLSVGLREDLAEVSQFNEILLSEVKCAPDSVELVVGDIRNLDDAINAVKGVDCIVHLAANTGVGPSVEDPRLDMESNVIGTFNMLDAARKGAVDRFIFASSGAPIGELKHPPIHEELAPHPVSPYGSSKLAGEGYCSSYFHSYGLKTIALRFGNVYGPRSKNKASVVAKFIKLALEDKDCEIYGDGSQTRDFIYIDDLISAIIKASITPVGGEVFQVASSSEVTINELAELIKQELLAKNIAMRVFNGNKRKGDVQRNYSDTRKSEQMLGWKSKVSLKEGITSTVHYFLAQKDKVKC